MAFLWPESQEEQARHRLSETLYVLRQSLGQKALISEGEQVRLDTERLDCDVVAFRKAVGEEDLEAAVNLYAGPFLDGFFLREAEEFQRWVESERQSLAQDYGLALESLAMAANRSTDPLEAVRWWNRLVTHDPYNSRFALGLMQALARAGDPGNAIHHAEEHVHCLREELGAEPPPEIPAFAEELRNGKSPVRTGGGPGRALSHAEPTQAQSDDARLEVKVDPRPARASIDNAGGPRKLWAIAAATVVLSLGVGAVYSTLTRDRAPELDPNLVVVPPFENRTGDPELDEAGLLAAFWVEEALQQVQEVHLAPSSFARHYLPGATEDGPLEATPFSTPRPNAGWAVSGTILERSDSLEFRVEVIDLVHPRREQLVVEAGVRDSLAGVMDRVARRVASALAYEFDPFMEEVDGGSQPLPTPPTIEAFREHRLGYQAADRGDWAASFRHQVAAYVLDTTLVRAVVAAAYMTGDYHLKDSLARFARERQHLLSRRGKLDLAALSAHLAGDHEGALEAWRESARLDGGGLTSVFEARHAIRVNRPREALEATERYYPYQEWRGAERHYYWGARTRALHMLGRFQEELEAARAGREQFPTSLSRLASEVRALAALGRVEEVAVRLHEARSLPNTYDSVALAAGVEFRAHGHAEASKQAFNQAVEGIRDGLSKDGRQWRKRLYLAWALYGAERWAEARDVARSLLEERPESLTFLGLVGLTEARLGDSVRAREMMSRLSGMERPNWRGEHLYQMASISAVLGHPDEAMRLLYQAFAEGLPHGLRLHQDMNFESLREREDFRALVAPKG